MATLVVLSIAFALILCSITLYLLLLYWDRACFSA